MKALKSVIIFLVLISLALALISCSKTESPIEPGSSADIISDTPEQIHAQSENRKIIGAYQVTVDPDLETLSITPTKRTGSFHYELLWDYPDVLTIEQWGFTPNFWADIKLSHPLPVSGVDVFDPRVIGIFPARTGVSVNFPTLEFLANDSVLSEPDGYTKIWDNASIDGNANPFIAYFKEQPYRQWSSINPQDQTKRWQMDIDGFGGVLTFELVVDISTNYPEPPYPYTDNVIEPFQIELLIGDGMTDEGGSVPVNAIISDWQGESTIGGVSIEAPDLFTGIVNLDYVEQINTFNYKYT